MGIRKHMCSDVCFRIPFPADSVALRSHQNDYVALRSNQCLVPIQLYIVNGVILLVQTVADGAYCNTLIARTNNRLLDVLRL
jgi:hypothetical protein